MISLAPFVSSPFEVVEKMLETDKVGKEDIVFDLGCGDGRILTTATKKFYVKKAVGFKIRNNLNNKALQEVKKQGLKSQISIIKGDVLANNQSEATMITLHLTTSGNEKLKPKLISKTREGIRVINHDLEISRWHASKRENFFMHSLCLYPLPEALIIHDEKTSSLKDLILFKTIQTRYNLELNLIHTNLKHDFPAS